MNKKNITLEKKEWDISFSITFQFSFKKVGSPISILVLSDEDAVDIALLFFHLIITKE